MADHYDNDYVDDVDGDATDVDDDTDDDGNHVDDDDISYNWCLPLVQTGEEYFQEITNLTQEIKKLAQFKDMVQHKMLLPLGEINRHNS